MKSPLELLDELFVRVATGLVRSELERKGVPVPPIEKPARKARKKRQERLRGDVRGKVLESTELPSEPSSDPSIPRRS